MSADLTLWKWANFAILAGGIGYLLSKHAGPFFASRSEEIRNGIAGAKQLQAEAEARSAEVERMLAAFDGQIEALHNAATEEGQAERQRIKRQTEVQLARIHQEAEQEIAAAARAARLELQSYTAGLAVALAREKIRERITPQDQDALFGGYIRDLEQSKTYGQPA